VLAGVAEQEKERECIRGERNGEKENCGRERRRGETWLLGRPLYTPGGIAAPGDESLAPPRE